jgi:hypothetical protein
VISGATGPGHRQVIAEDDAFEAELFAQNVLEPDPRVARGLPVHAGVDYVRRHDAAQPRGNRGPVGRQILALDFRERSPVHGNRDMRVGGDKSVPRKMLADRSHAAVAQTADQSCAQRADSDRVEMQRPVADHRASAVIQVEHRREAEIQPVGRQLGGNDIARGPCRRLARLSVAIPQAAQCPHGGKRGEALAEPLHPSALVVHADEQVRLTQRVDLLGERLQLRGVLEIAGEQDDATGSGVQQPAAVVVVQGRACRIQDHRTQRQTRLQPSHSRITVAAAMPRSSVNVRCERRMPRLRSSAPSAAENSSCGLPDR